MRNPALEGVAFSPGPLAALGPALMFGAAGTVFLAWRDRLIACESGSVSTLPLPATNSDPRSLAGRF